MRSIARSDKGFTLFMPSTVMNGRADEFVYPAGNDLGADCAIPMATVWENPRMLRLRHIYCPGSDEPIARAV